MVNVHTTLFKPTGLGYMTARHLGRLSLGALTKKMNENQQCL